MVSSSTTRIGVSHLGDRAKRPHGPPITWLTPATAGAATDGVEPAGRGPDDPDPDDPARVTRASFHPGAGVRRRAARNRWATMRLLRSRTDSAMATAMAVASVLAGCVAGRPSVSGGSSA